jgi:Uma2 family endonuclease
MKYNNESAAKGYHLIKESGWTAEEYQSLPEDDRQYEVVSGKLELLPSPTTTHQRIIRRLMRIIEDCCEVDYIIIHAPVDVILSDNETRQPDILMVHRSREHIIHERGIYGAPDLVVEILSPGSAKRDRVMKKESYARFGVPEYWIVDPIHLTIEQYVLIRDREPYQSANIFADEDTVRSDLLPCVSFVVKDALKLI